MNNEKYVAFDVHLATIAFCILDFSGKIIWEGIFQNKADTIRDFLRGIRGRIHLTFEQGTQAAWLYDLVKPLVHTAVVCNPRYNRIVLCGNKSDRIDARKLAEQLRIGKLRPVYQTEHSLRPLKQLVLGYEALITDSVRTMTRIKSLFQGRGIPCPGEKLYSPSRHGFWLSQIKETGSDPASTFSSVSWMHSCHCAKNLKRISCFRAASIQPLRYSNTFPAWDRSDPLRS